LGSLFKGENKYSIKKKKTFGHVRTKIIARKMFLYSTKNYFPLFGKVIYILTFLIAVNFLTVIYIIICYFIDAVVNILENGPFYYVIKD